MDDSLPPDSAPAPLRYAASIAVYHEGAVLLVRRGRAPGLGLWSLPGGKFEEGESPRAAALRELAEETGITAEVAGVLDVIEVLATAEGGEELRYRLTVFYGRYAGGELAAGSDAGDASWVPLDQLDSLLMTKESAVLIRVAARRLGVAEN